MKYIVIITMLTFSCKAFTQIDTVKYLTNTFSKMPNKFVNKTFGYFDSTLKAKIKSVAVVGCFDFIIQKQNNPTDSFPVKRVSVFFENYKDFIEYKKKKRTPEITLTFKIPIKVSRSDMQYLSFEYSAQAKALLKDAIISKVEVE